ncbi:MAG: TIGR02281 family clan AA aspartic protease [Sulfuriferula sp.]
MSHRLTHTTLLTLVTLSAVNLAHATNINVTGLFTDRAMVMIDGGKPRVMAVGETVQGIRLLRADAHAAVFDVDGKKRTLSMGESYSGGANNSAKPVAILSADARGQFFTTGTINGSSVHFVVDTGATSVTISTQEADRLGVDYRRGQRGATSTANGLAVAYRVIFNNIRVGGISLNMVPGTVIEGSGLPLALLGMSFLNQTSMQRDGTTMTLTQRY